MKTNCDHFNCMAKARYFGWQQAYFVCEYVERAEIPEENSTQGEGDNA